MKNRIKAIRASLRQSQSKFGEELSVSMSAVRKWEDGDNEPSDAVVALMERKFSVNPDWLRTGEGEMFKPKTRADEIGELVEDILGGYIDPQLEQIILALKSCTPEQIKAFCEVCQKVTDAQKKRP